MKIKFKIQRELLKSAMANLRRRHVFAAERVGFFLCRPSHLPEDGLLILAQGFHAVADEDYLNDPKAGATMGSHAIRKALEAAYNQGASMFHVHIHEHRGKPGFSSIDSRETARFVPDFWNVQPALPHGAIVLSQDSAFGKCWMPDKVDPTDISEFISVGVPMRRL
ncbi:MAG: hypothetical protein LAO76_26905 [Acidobacteriia bacterium]|nr:hypothetical protein [Terriglobia bacterium]